MTDENKEIESAADEQQLHSEESKFFGIKTQILPRAGDSEPDDDVKIEIVDTRKQEDRRPKKAEAKAESSDDESEIESYGTRVKKRIDKLKYEYHEERRQKEEASRLRDEAITYAQRIQEENKRLSALVTDSQKAIQQQITERAKAAGALAEAELRRAHESGDADAIVKAQQSLTRAQLTEAAAPSYASQIAAKLRESKVDYEPPNVLSQAAKSVPQPDAKASRWQADNQWFGKDPEMTSFAYGVHQKLISEHGQDYATSDAYYEAINKRMRQVFPDRFSEEDEIDFEADQAEVETRAAAPRKASKRMPVVAPATRSSGSAPRKVQLTATQVALAKRLGLTPQQYAMQVMKEMKNG
jgi:hypothetical protein